MHDIYNPWHGCKKISEGCQNCYMYYLDQKRNQDGHYIYKTQNFNYLIARDKNGDYKIKSGEVIRVCMTSDFFLEEADQWRKEVWQMISQRRDVIFYILTKRPKRIKECLPDDWDEGYDHVILNVTCENQRQADIRIPILLDIPAKHKGIMCAPLIGAIDVTKYLKQGQIEQIIVGGENYGGCRPCHHEWVEALFYQAKKQDIKFCFIETGTYYIKDNKRYHIPSKKQQASLAFKSKMQHIGKPTVYHLIQENTLFEQETYQPHYRQHCLNCGSRLICDRCSDCGRCQESIILKEQMDQVDHFSFLYSIKWK